MAQVASVDDEMVFVEAPSMTMGAAGEPLQRQSTRVLAEPEEQWVRETAKGTGIPLPAMRAYARAALNSPEECGLGWSTLAGVGWVETHHGSIGDRALDRHGMSSSEIYGPALDGSEGVAAIRASESGAAWHGDHDWEHAVGPMQFLPSTWETWGVDGDGDGDADPHDIDDAAMAAAAYLCEAGGDLSGLSGWTAGVRAYNDSEAYVSEVNQAALRYASY